MDFQPVLENKRVLLQPLQWEHLEALLPVALNPEVKQRVFGKYDF